MASATNVLAAEPALSQGAHIRALETSTPTTSVSATVLDNGDLDVLPARHFFKQLNVEKRRADRIKSPLSLILIHVDAARGGGLAVMEDLIDLLGSSKRETDVLGHVAKDRIGLLLTHTGEQGARVFVGNLAKRTADYPISITACTYPDQVFESLMGDMRDVPETLTFFVHERTNHAAFAILAKRAVDVVGALTALVLLSPIMVAAALAVALTSPGQIIFRQKRIGKGGVPFILYKFRSMRADADDRVHREYVASLIDGRLDRICQGDRRPWSKMRADPRVTTVGRFMRKTSIDELPQLINVIKGDMSLVGPRPPLPYEAEKYQSWHLRRVLHVRPGVTGLWQVEGSSTTTFDDMVRLDLRYSSNWSLWLDLKILLKTVAVVLRRDGAR